MTAPAFSQLRHLWVARAPLTDDAAGFNRPQRQTRAAVGAGGPWERRLTSAAWPIAVLLVVHSVAILAVNGSVTDDFTTVYSAVRRFLDGVPVYNENYAHVDPHYLYNPGATLLLSPLGVLGFTATRAAFILANAAAIIAGLAVLTRMFGHSLRGALWPVSIAAAFMTESVRNTLVFSNINGILFLVFVGFLATHLKQARWASGVLLGLAILVKPMFAPLLLLPLVKGHWQAILGAVGVPVIANAVAWPLIPGAGDYVTVVMPYLGQTRDYANSSLAGLAVYFGMPGAVHGLFFLLLAAAVAIAVIGLARWRYTDPLLWAVSTSGVLLVGVFVLSSLGQMYYSMLVFPVFFAVLQRRSLAHSWVMWAAAFLFLAPVSWLSERWVDYGRWLTYFSATAGWSVFLIAAAAIVARWVWAERMSGGDVEKRMNSTAAALPLSDTTDSKEGTRD